MAKAKGKRNHRKEKLEFVQDYLPIRDLKNGIIETTDNRYIKILEIEPITFGPGEQETEFTVSFSKAEEGVKYTCEIRIEDPRYISLLSLIHISEPTRH